ncbi:MAG: hypothetical protein VZR05_01255 [Lachnospiraceae bacterium]|nr:hypothetical protein [Lachnospiraceae bacterium]MBR6397278.1 hypothetical protein [Lachnospiraceae bacterium]MBR7014869.1 hypothetical protein [Lachnospiraceae bacterium]MEE3436753.1 hypothetical protein [Lachnospiraceae bacterium]MEE3457468.1 hypothetical protein [Lachnospiraceae bacterium]
MKTDVVVIYSDGSEMEEALVQAEKTAQYKGLSHKAALHLRLLTEEMLGMMRSITGNVKGRFWIEDEKGAFQLHLKVKTFVDFEKREQLLKASTSGKNEAARGIMGKIRTFFDPLDGLQVPYNSSPDGTSADFIWSMRAYEQTVQNQLDAQEAGAKEAWDELERSVVNHLADDVKVYIQGRDVEMVIIKKMEE